MVRLAIHVFLRSGREALVRLLITAAAVAVGVALLLSAFAIYHGYRTTIDRACWTCTGQPDPASLSGPAEPGPVSTAPVSNGELW